MKKRFLAAVLALVMTAACMTSCGGENKTEDKLETTTTTTAETTTTTEKETGVIDTFTITKVTTTKITDPPPSEIPQDLNPGQWHEDSETTTTTTTKATTTTAKATTTNVNTTAKPKTTTTKATTSKKKNTDQKIAGYIRMGDKKQGIRNVKGVPAWKFESGFSSHGEVTIAKYSAQYYTCEVILLYDGMDEDQIRDCYENGIVMNPEQYKGHTLTVVCGGALARFPEPVTYLRYYIKLGNGSVIRVEITPGGEYAKKNCPKGQDPTTWARNNLDKFSSVFKSGQAGREQYFFIIDALI